MTDRLTREEVERLLAPFQRPRPAVAMQSLHDPVEPLARTCLALMDERDNPGTTHADGCHAWGPKHYECAVARIAELEATSAPSSPSPVTARCGVGDHIKTARELVAQPWWRWLLGMALVDEHCGTSFIVHHGRYDGRIPDLHHDANVGPLHRMVVEAWCTEPGRRVLVETDATGTRVSLLSEDAFSAVHETRATHTAHALALALLEVRRDR